MHVCVCVCVCVCVGARALVNSDAVYNNPVWAQMSKCMRKCGYHSGA